MKTIDRILAGALGAIVFSVLTPLLYALLIGWPGSLTAFGWLAAAGAVVGIVFGVCFARFFIFVLEFIAEIFSD